MLERVEGEWRKIDPGHPGLGRRGRAWRLTRQVSDILRGLPWVLIGGQMVAIIEIEHGVSVGRDTADVDTLVDVRALSTATEEAAARLLAAGFAPKPEDDGLAYRFSRDGDIVDVLAPDNLGRRRNLTTVPPDETLETIGGTQANRRRSGECGSKVSQKDGKSGGQADRPKVRGVFRPGP